MDRSMTSPLLEKLKHPRWKWARMPVGIVLILCGLVGFLPIVGFWMIPLGLSILAIDYPPARRALRHVETAMEAARRKFRGRGTPPDHKPPT
jgi:hypothetical protein